MHNSPSINRFQLLISSLQHFPWVFQCFLNDLQTHPLYHNQKVFSPQASSASISITLLLFLWMASSRWTMALSSWDSNEANPTSSSDAYMIQALPIRVISTQRWFIVIFFRVKPNESQCSELWLKLLGKRPFVSIELLSYKDINLDLLLASFSKAWEKPAWEIKIGKQSWKMERHGFPTASMWGLYPVVLTVSIIPPNFSVVKLNKLLFFVETNLSSWIQFLSLATKIHHQYDKKSLLMFSEFSERYSN